MAAGGCDEIKTILMKKRTTILIKRILDILLSTISLAIIWPFLIFIGILIRVDSSGPIFYRQNRVGLHGTPFRIFKFRTMVIDADKKGLSITTGQDPRITRIGRVLRKTKVDELPQLINIIKGEMSFVGPRPEVPRYANMYSSYQKQVLLVRPGITDYASIVYRNENEMLDKVAEPEDKYINDIMPSKIELNLKYIREISLITDIKIIFQTLAVVVKGA